MSAPRSAIEGIEFFSGLDQRLLKKVAESAIVSEYAADEMIIREGELGLGMYVITRGRVAVTHEDNGRTIKLAELGANQCFAEMALIDDKPRSANVVTVEETECLLFTRDTFLKLMEKHPALSIRLARTLAARLRAMRSEERRVGKECR